MRSIDSAEAPPGFSHSLALVIGIDAYTHGIPPLRNAVRDARAIADSLERQGFEVLRLLDDQASLDALTRLLTQYLPSLPTPPDRLLIYFAGHGLARTDERHQFSGFLMPCDARRDEPATYWPMASLRGALCRLPCRHLLLILDCCFAGAFPLSRDVHVPAPPIPLHLERFRHFSSRRSFQLLLSTAHDELASDELRARPTQERLGDGRHSPFALALMRALARSSPADANQDGLLTASELYAFLRDTLLSLLPCHQAQTPSLWNLDWHDGGEFLFLLSGSLPALPSIGCVSASSNPYLGLSPFTSAHRHLFFGREYIVESLRESLRTRPLLRLCGPSGSGKTSVVHAGLIPLLSDEGSWLVPPTLRPASQPLDALSAWLASVAPELNAPSASALAERPGCAVDFLLTVLARRPEHSLLLVIDALEELVTTCRDPAANRNFLRALSGLLLRSHPRLRMLWVMRSDFEAEILSLPPAPGPSAEILGRRPFSSPAHEPGRIAPVHREAGGNLCALLRSRPGRAPAG
ncbi:nSTAND1 domain-containing NTPase [Melittangium boletus]|uniref:nSTAND1 domain-containing NTPase n=1 Tax=Melittangium boletus TaxID=83453 RepID=UPI003DA42CED